MKTIFLTILLSLLTITQNWAYTDNTKHINAEYTKKPDTLTMLSKSDNFLATQEEEYIDDYPLDTKKISAEYYKANMPRPMAEATFYDFPYETKVIAERYLNKILPEIAPVPEQEIDDFPMNTADIARTYLSYKN